MRRSSSELPFDAVNNVQELTLIRNALSKWIHAAQKIADRQILAQSFIQVHSDGMFDTFKMGGMLIKAIQNTTNGSCRIGGTLLFDIANSVSKLISRASNARIGWYPEPLLFGEIVCENEHLRLSRRK